MYIVADLQYNVPDSMVYGANMGPIWGRQDPDGPHIGPMNFASRGVLEIRWWRISMVDVESSSTLQWRHNERDGVPKHQPYDSLLNRLFRRKQKKKHQSSESLAFVMGIHRWPVNSPHKGPVTRKMFPFDDVIM